MRMVKGIQIGMFYVFLVAFYVFVVVFSVSLLATAQLRSSSGLTFDTWRLNFDSNRVPKEKHEKQLKALMEKSSTNRLDMNFTEQCLRLYEPSGKLKPEIYKQTLKEVEAAKADEKKYGYDFVYAKLNGVVRCVFRDFTMLAVRQGYFQEHG